MLQAEQVEELICVVSAMDREGLIQQFAQWQGRFPVDFTEDFLRLTPLERLRHIFVALCLQSQQVPDTLGAAA
jgi:hypothetical protein